MLVKDEALIEKHVQAAAYEAEHDRILNAAEAEMRLATYIEEGDDITNLVHQLGNPLAPEEFEKRLAKLAPALKFEVHPTNNTKRCAYLLDQRGKYCVAVYENSIMPEHSWFSCKTEFVRDMEVTCIERSELPKHEIVTDADGNPDVVFEPGVAGPGLRKVVRPHKEILRGWRTALIKVLLERVASLDAIEREFGSANRASWAGHTGKTAVTTPY
jgi:hypothetical protein